jgi:hypothetical protein
MKPTKSSLSFLALSSVLASGLVLSQSWAATTPPNSPAGVVTIEIVEPIPDDPSWNFTPPEPTEIYQEPAFGFVGMPTRYSATGVKIDRAKAFLYRATAQVALPKGEHLLLLRARSGSRLLVDGHELLSTRFPDLRSDGHEEVPEVPKAVAPDIRYLRPGHYESLTNFVADGQPHKFVMEVLVGLKDRRPELGETSVSVSCACDDKFFLLAPSSSLRVPLTEGGFEGYLEERRSYWKAHDVSARRTIAASEEKYWDWRHELARKLDQAVGAKTSNGGSIDDFINQKLKAARVQPAPLTDDYAFLRRLSLDTTGLIPTSDQIEGFAKDARPDKRARVIDRLLVHPGWADHWVSYWQDVLAENPGILKPMLNNTGPFRWWIHESFADNKPMDRFVSELIAMEGSLYYGGPAGFGMATDNDVPMAQKAQIVAQAFLGMQMQCARCHDAPNHHFKQKELFSLAAMLKRAPQTVPWSSSIPTNSHITIGRKVKVTLAPGSKVEPAWPFASLVAESDLPDGVLRKPGDTREKLAALVTDPRNGQFAKVLANRIWKRYLGWGIVEPVDDWEGVTPSHPELLDYLARELVTHDYDLKHLARLILNSQAYQRSVRPDGSESKPANERLFAAPARRRLTAEQLVDSLFSAVGKPLSSEELNMDVDGRRSVKDFINLGIPSRAWEFTSLSNERDRPALSLPRAQSVVDALTTFGWRESRQNPLTVRDDSANAVQPATLANGVLSHGRIARLSDESGITELVLEERPLPELVRELYLRVLSRLPTDEEREVLQTHLAPGYNTRRNPEFARVAAHAAGPARAVSWANHLNPEATRIKQEQERSARMGDAPTLRLRPEWRERAEDALWALVNSPEFVFVP